MFKIIDSKEIISRDEVEKRYEDCNVLFRDKDEQTGSVYAISDNDSVGRLIRLYFESRNKGIRFRYICNVRLRPIPLENGKVAYIVRHTILD